MPAPTLDEACVGTRAYRVLKAAGVKTLADLLGWTREDLLALSGLSFTTLREVEAMMAEHGLSLRPSEPKPRKPSPNSRLTPEEGDALLRDYQRGLGNRELGRRYGISPQAAYLRVRNAGLIRSHEEAVKVRTRRSTFTLRQRRVERTWASAYDAAEFLCLDKSHVCALCRGGQLAGAFRLGKSPHAPWLIPWESLRSYKETR